MKSKAKANWLLIFALFPATLLSISLSTKSNPDPMDWEIRPFLSMNLIDSLNSRENGQLHHSDPKAQRNLKLAANAKIHVSELKSANKPSVSKDWKISKNSPGYIKVKAIPENLGNSKKVSIAGANLRNIATDSSQIVTHAMGPAKEISSQVASPVGPQDRRKLKRDDNLSSKKGNQLSRTKILEHVSHHSHSSNSGKHHSHFHIGHIMKLSKVLSKNNVHNYETHFRLTGKHQGALVASKKKRSRLHNVKLSKHLKNHKMVSKHHRRHKHHKHHRDLTTNIRRLESNI